MLELLIRGGDVVTPEGVATCDVAIAGERIEIGRASCRERV